VRATLEGMAWRFAAEKGLDLGTQKKLARCIDEGADIIKKIGYEDFDEPAWQRMNNRFYSAIVPAAGSHFLKTQVEQIISIPLATAYVVPNWGGS
jgi:GntR family transcriptional regulator of vanillate catabolism